MNHVSVVLFGWASLQWFRGFVFRSSGSKDSENLEIRSRGIQGLDGSRSVRCRIWLKVSGLEA